MSTKTAIVADTILNGYWNNGIYPGSRTHPSGVAMYPTRPRLKATWKEPKKKTRAMS